MAWNRPGHGRFSMDQDFNGWQALLLENAQGDLRVLLPNHDTQPEFVRPLLSGQSHDFCKVSTRAPLNAPLSWVGNPNLEISSLIDI